MKSIKHDVDDDTRYEEVPPLKLISLLFSGFVRGF